MHYSLFLNKIIQVEQFEYLQFDLYLKVIIKADITMFDIYRYYIHELLDLIIEYRFTPSIYLTFILGILKEHNVYFEQIKNKIKKILYIPSSQEDIKEIQFSSGNDLKEIFNILAFGLDDIFARIFWKLYYNVQFNQYIEKHTIEECYLIKDYIKSYEDYKKFIQLVLYYYNNFTYTMEKEGLTENYKIDINYFFSGLKNENFTKYLEELIENKNKDELLILLNVIPVESNHKEILVSTLNFLENEILEEDLIVIFKKDIFPKKEYENFLNEKSYTDGIISPFNIANDEINKKIDILTYVSNNLSNNLSVLNEIDNILVELQETKKMVNEMSLEHTIR
jgi:hypothetical protein